MGDAFSERLQPRGPTEMTGRRLWIVASRKMAIASDIGKKPPTSLDPTVSGSN
jgi:hypothetical protein